MKVLTGTEYRLTGGVWNVKVTTTGTASLAYRVEAEPYQTITGVDYTANAADNITIPSCTVKPTLTGDAVMYLTLIENH